MLALLLRLQLGALAAFGSPQVVADSAPVISSWSPPFIHLPGHGWLRTAWHPDAEPEFIDKFMMAVPFESFLFHTVSSGHNLCFLLPNLGDRSHMRSEAERGRKARSASPPGTLFLRSDTLAVLNYGPTQDHESFMPPLLIVDARDLPAVLKFAKKFWEEQMLGESKRPFSLALTHQQKPLVGGPLFNDEVTGNRVVDDTVMAIRSQTTRYWLVPPQEVANLMTTGDALGLEGTEGYIFPPMVIGNGVFMILATYAQSGAVNALAAKVEDGSITKENLNSTMLVVKELADKNLPYLRALSLHMVCRSFEKFVGALDKARTMAEVRVLSRAISLFGAVVHGWLVYLFPYQLGRELRRIFKIESPAKFEVPLRHRPGRALGVATWDIGRPTDRENVSRNMHLPVTLQSGSLPLILSYRPVEKKMAHRAKLARAEVEKHLAEKGAILFRNLPLSNFSQASDFIKGLGYKMYPDPSGREKVTDLLAHSALAVPADINISPHQEHIVAAQPPKKLFLFCQSPSPKGGQTPLAHAGDVWDALPKVTQDQLRRRGVRWEMVRGNAAAAANPVKFTRSWQEHFATEDLSTARAKASEQFNGTLTVDEHGNILMRSERVEAVQVVQGREIYRSQLQNIYSLRWLWGDSDEYVNDVILEQIMSSVWSPAMVFSWQAGDVLLVDNELVLHGRLSYDGERFVGVALAED